MNHDVFISYSSKDKTVADAICHVLEQKGLTCWIAPRDVQPGARYAAEIVNGIKNCRVMVLVYSKNSNQSDHVANEVDRAFNSEKTIIPFLVDDTPMNDEFDYYLARKHWLVAYPEYAEQLEHLAVAVANVLGKELKPLGNPERVDAIVSSHDTKEDVIPQQPETTIHIEVDADCDLYLFKEKFATLRYGEDNSIQLKPGSYKLSFISCEYPDVKEQKIYRITSDMFTDFIEVSLQGKVLEKFRAEAAKRNAEEEAKRQKEAEAKRRADEQKRKAEEAAKRKAIEEKKLFPICRNGKYGFIDKTGIIVIPCRWQYAGEFSEGLARVKDDFFKWGFIDKMGNIAIPCRWPNARGFSEGLARVWDDHYKNGFIDKEGKVVIPCQWVGGDTPFSEGLACVENENGKYGFVDKTGKTIIPFKWKYVGPFSEGLAAVRDENDKWGFIDKEGNEIIPCQWKGCYKFTEGLAYVKDESDKYGFIDKTGEVVIDCQWEHCFLFSEGLARVKDEHRRYGFIDKTGKIVIPCRWENAHSFSEGVAAVQNNESHKWGFIDKIGNIVIPCQWTDTDGFSEGLAKVQDDDLAYFYIDKKDVIIQKWTSNNSG